MAKYELEIRRLVPGDEAMVDTFLTPLTASSMFLRSNMRQAGVTFEGQPLQGIYFGAFKGEELLGVVAHYWNGNLLFQAPEHLLLLANTALQNSDLPLKGIIGPLDQTKLLEVAFAVPSDQVQTSFDDGLFTLDLKVLRLPDNLAENKAKARRGFAEDLDMLLEWRTAYALEALNEQETVESRTNNLRRLKANHEDGRLFVLEAEGIPVATCSFNAIFDDYVQIGGVWTPPDLRSRGYGRAIVAGALDIARKDGMQTAILFTNVPAAERAYTAIGFQQIGGYGIVLFNNDVRALI